MRLIASSPNRSSNLQNIALSIAIVSIFECKGTTFYAKNDAPCPETLTDNCSERTHRERKMADSYLQHSVTLLSIQDLQPPSRPTYKWAV
jgi:hypothetical protein